jgi:hypothetical protein
MNPRYHLRENDAIPFLALLEASSEFVPEEEVLAVYHDYCSRRGFCELSPREFWKRVQAYLLRRGASLERFVMFKYGHRIEYRSCNVVNPRRAIAALDIQEALNATLPTAPTPSRRSRM